MGVRVGIRASYSVDFSDRFSRGEALCLGQSEWRNMASLEGFQWRLLWTLHKLKRMKEENP